MAPQTVDPNQPVFDIKTMNQVSTEETSGVRAPEICFTRSYASCAMRASASGSRSRGLWARSKIRACCGRKPRSMA